MVVISDIYFILQTQTFEQTDRRTDKSTYSTNILSLPLAGKNLSVRTRRKSLQVVSE